MMHPFDIQNSIQGTIWIWGFSDNDSPRAIPNIQLDQPLDFVTFNDRFTLTSDTLYRLEGNGLLYITLLNSLDKVNKKNLSLENLLL